MHERLIEGCASTQAVFLKLGRFDVLSCMAFSGALALDVCWRGPGCRRRMKSTLNFLKDWLELSFLNVPSSLEAGQHSTFVESGAGAGQDFMSFDRGLAFIIYLRQVIIMN